MQTEAYFMAWLGLKGLNLNLRFYTVFNCTACRHN